MQCRWGSGIARIACAAAVLAAGSAAADDVPLKKDERAGKGAITVRWPCEIAPPELAADHAGGRDGAELAERFERSGRPRPLVERASRDDDGKHRSREVPAAMVEGAAFKWFIFDGRGEDDDDDGHRKGKNRGRNGRGKEGHGESAVSAKEINAMISGAGGIQPESESPFLAEGEGELPVLVGSSGTGAAAGGTPPGAGTSAPDDSLAGKTVDLEVGSSAGGQTPRSSPFDRDTNTGFLNPALDEAVPVAFGGDLTEATLIPLPPSAWIGLGGLAFAGAWRVLRRR